ncbi:precorrin-6B methylase [Lawsonibacter celer]|jgi:precorrin-6B methylase 2|uniref:precorrin-6B methylase n=1 Tax=Lawsonibacter celer TaxID=2986526 RepID=UPI0016486920|nr:precorrin-6B methylase [Lawsonibacter celer]
MEQQLFSNSHILAWLQYFSEHTQVDLEKVKILDITRKNKNLIPTVESHSAVLVFTEAGHPDIFYRMWDAGLGECEVWYNEGSEPSGPILHKPLREMINRGINASAGMLILNPTARSTYKIGMRNSSFSRGSIHYVGSEIRSVILNKMHLAQGDTVCIISGESIAVESAILAPEGTVIAVEYNQNDRNTMEENAHQFGLNNIAIIDHVDDESLRNLPVPSLTMLVASASMEQEIECLLRRNPHMEFVIYTLDFPCAASLPALFERYGIGETEVIQIAVSKLNSKHQLVAEPAPWLISGKA